MKKFFINSVTLVILVIFFQFLFLTAKINSFKQLKILEKAKEEKTDVIFFGDSSASNYGLNDSDKRSLPEMLRGMIKSRTLASIDNPAYAAEVFLAFTEKMVKENYYPKLVVIPINMRSFSPSWDKNPGYQFEDLKAILKSKIDYIFLKTVGTFNENKGLSEITQQEFEKTEVYNGKEPVGRAKEFESHQFRHYSEKNMKDSILYFYMSSLDENHEKISALLEIARLLKENNIKPVFYITPIDFQTGEKYFPNQFFERLEENTELVKLVLKKQGIRVMDLSFSLGSEFFAWEKYPNEHLNEKGRDYVARRIAERINGQEELTSEQCKKYSPEKCPSSCLVCPPCISCSSISCNSVGFCEGLGFDESWYNMIEAQKMRAR